MKVGFKVTDYYTNCPNCKKALLKNDPKGLHAEINLNKVVRNYVFCNYKCFAEKLEKINPPAPKGTFELKIRLKYKEKISSNPEKWIVLFEVEDLKVI